MQRLQSFSYAWEGSGKDKNPDYASLYVVKHTDKIHLYPKLHPSTATMWEDLD